MPHAFLKRQCFLLFLFHIMFSFSVQLFSDINLIKNSDFELGAKNWLLDKGCSITDQQVHIGQQALYISSAKSGTNPCVIQNGIKLNVGKRYRLTYWVMAGGGSSLKTGYQRFRVYISWDTPDGKKLLQDEGRNWQDTYNIWQKRSLEFSSPLKPNSEMMITCQIQGPGSIYLDNFKLEPINDEVSSLVDIDIRTSTPRYQRDAIFSSCPIESLCGHIVKKSNKIDRIELSLIDEQKILWTKTISIGRPPLSFSIPFSDIKYGEYKLEAKIFAENNKLLGVTCRKIRKLPPAPVEVCFREDQVMLINGKPFFPIGIWDTDIGEKEFYELNKAGFNIIKSAVDKTVLDIADKYNIKVIGELPCDFPKNNEIYDNVSFVEKDKMAIIKSLANHKALAAYYLVDEPLWGGKPVEPINSVYQVCQKQDPYRPVWINFAPRNSVASLAKYTEACDIVGADIYPVPEGGHSDLDDKTITCVGKYTDKMQQTVNSCKPVWMVLQGFAWAHIYGPVTNYTVSYPTWEQSRFMAYDAIVHGATGIIYWGTNIIVEPDFWRDLLRVSSELRDMSPVFVSDTIKDSQVAVNNSSIKILHKKSGGKDYIIAVNESSQALNAKFDTSFADQELNVFFENRKIQAKKGIFNDKFQPYGVHVYSNSNKLPLPLVPSVAKVETLEKGDPFFIKKSKILKFGNPYRGAAKWVWYPDCNKKEGEKVYFRYIINLEDQVEKAIVRVATNKMVSMRVNGIFFGGTSGWNVLREYDITTALKKGDNIIAIEAQTTMGPSGMLLDADIQTVSGKKIDFISDETWQSSIILQLNWYSNSVGKELWKPVKIIAPYGKGPWKNGVRKSR